MQDSFELLERIKNYKSQSLVSHLEGFIGSQLHTDFRNEIILRIEQMRDFNEECGSKEYLETRGGIKAMRMVYDIFETMLINRKEDLEMEETNEEDL